MPAGLNKQVAGTVQTLDGNTVAAPVDRQLAAALNGQVIVALDREHRKVLIHHQRGVTKQDNVLARTHITGGLQTNNILGAGRNGGGRNQTDHHYKGQQRTQNLF